MGRIVVEIALPAWKFEAFYRGGIRDVIVRALDGRSVRLPAGVLRSHVTSEGVHGVFEVRFDAEHRLRGVRRLGASEASLARRGVRG